MINEKLIDEIRELQNCVILYMLDYGPIDCKYLEIYCEENGFFGNIWFDYLDYKDKYYVSMAWYLFGFDEIIDKEESLVRMENVIGYLLMRV